MIFWLNPRRRSAAPKSDSKGDKSDAKPERPSETGRETFDQLLYAFLLLITARAFLIEPFVIPTGSMAPTLYGRHKECECESCGFNFQIGASGELINDGRFVQQDGRITLATCPNCRFPNDVMQSPAFNGDHVAVNKWAYTLGDPSRFDVFVFKFPHQPERNYIKRLVGLPNEVITIRNGDLYLATDDGDEILRKNQPRKRKAMTQLVHDNDTVSPALQDVGWPERWTQPGENDDKTGPAEDRSFTLTSAKPTVRYTHWIADAQDWSLIAAGKPVDPRPHLISDYCAYNAYTGERRLHDTGVCSPDRPSVGLADRIDTGNYWVPDIGFECDIDSDDVTTVTLELVEGVYRYRCHLNGETGEAKLVTVNVQQDPSDERDMATAPTRFRTGGRYKIRFSNIDDELMLWVDDEPVEFGDGAKYTRRLIDNTLPTESDVAPAAVTIADGSARVSHLKVFRDVYYIPDNGGSMGAGFLRCALRNNLDNPTAYADTYDAASDDKKSIRVASQDGYLAFGDNSARSNDSRLWTRSKVVPEDRAKFVPASHLVGKAFWIYWPHGVPFLNGGRGIPITYHQQLEMAANRGPVARKIRSYPKYVVPFYPQFSRMTRIR